MATHGTGAQEPFTELSAEKAEGLIRPYLEDRLSEEELGAFEAYVDAHPAFAKKVEKRGKLVGFMNSAMASRKLSKDFSENTNDRLARKMNAPEGESGDYDREDDGYYDEEEEEPLPAPNQGFLDSLSNQFGAAPWWMISGAFHALVVLLVTLIGMALLRAQTDDIVIVTDLEQQKPPEEIKKEPERTVIPVPQVVENTEVVSEQQQIFTHEEVEIADHVETADNSDAAETRGEDGISDVFLGGSGNVAALGLGGGGGGAFGRPGGRGGRLRRATQGGGGQATESAVDKALEWLARHQEADGSWNAKKCEGAQDWDLGITGLATLAFLGAGHTEKVGKYKGNVSRSVQWMISKQDAEGGIGNGTDRFGYHHSICGMALAEAAAMARVPATLAAAQKAINWTCEKHQYGNQSDKLGWRYQPKDQAGDLSNSGWFIMQLKSAKVAGLNVDPGSFEGAMKYLDLCMTDPVNVKKDPNSSFDTGGHRYGYQKGNGPWHNTTSIGILGRLFTGTKPEEVAGALRWVMDAEPLNWNAGLGKGVENTPFPMYFTYYTTLTAFQVGGDLWNKWNNGMKAMLLNNQRKDGDADGSWDPLGGPEKEAGRAYTTAMGAMCLEVYYRYLPMYRE